MCLVLSVVSKILDSSELLSCPVEMGVEYYLVCIREGLLCGKGMESPRGRGMVKWSSGDVLREMLVVISNPDTPKEKQTWCKLSTLLQCK